MKTESICPLCGEKSGDLVFCRGAVGQYGSIVVADCVCESCNGVKWKDQIIDNDGNFPPLENRRCR
jgi:C4-type Zn-finger protein